MGHMNQSHKFPNPQHGQQLRLAGPGPGALQHLRLELHGGHITQRVPPHPPEAAQN
jgi:hypothetical protein